MVFRDIDKSIDYFTHENYVPLEVKKGSVVIFDGHFIHKSFKNTSDECREAYTIHLFDGIDNWSKKVLLNHKK
jgi:ectoine hydroxylase-related dioxygenase (phytanoyl-CoA dioxygenase family)